MMRAKLVLPDTPTLRSGRGLKSVLRLLYTYQLLIRNPRLDLSMVNTAFYAHPKIAKTITAETMRHYRQTLEAFGCRIEHAKSKTVSHWSLTSHPLQLTLSPTEQHVLQALLEKLSQLGLPQGDAVLRGILAQTFCSLGGAYQAPVYQSSVAQLAHQLEGYCKAHQWIRLQGPFHNDLFTRLTVVPQSLVSELGQVYLLAVETQTHDQIRVNLAQIESVEHLPTVSALQPNTFTAVFELSGRLARNYRPYWGETLEPLPEGPLRVTHQGVDKEGLLRRLMKYGALCRVVSPDWAAQGMQQKIAGLLQALQSSADGLAPGGGSVV